MTPITETAELEEFCRRLQDVPFVCVDTEFMREKTFWPVLCLIQIAGPDDTQLAAVDTLAPGLDLTAFFALLDDPNIVKVFHAARQDLEIFHHLTGRVPAPLFDTQIAAMVCGFGDAVSYQNLAAKLAGASIDKSSRFTDWSLRPLSERQIDYALSDVIHLRVIYSKLRERLEKSGRTSWLEEEEAILLDPETYRQVPEEAWRRLKVRSNKRKFLAVLKTLAAWREHEAQTRDLPRNRILRDDTLIEIAAHAPRSADDLARSRGLSEKAAKGQMGAGILKAVKAGLALPPKEIPRLQEKPRLPGDAAPIIDMLKLLLKAKSAEHGVAQKLIANVADLELLATDDNAPIAALQGWRRQIFGDDALAVKRGDLGLAVGDGRVKLISLKDRAETSA